MRAEVTWCKVLGIVGAGLGWVGGVTVAMFEVVPESKAVPVMMLFLSWAIVATAVLYVTRYQRPLGAAFELGYEAGRRDAIREATSRSNVSPIRRAPQGLSEFNQVTGS